MANKKVSITVIQQINRKLAAKGQVLTATRRLMRSKQDRGDYCILDLSGNVMDTHIDPEELARKLGVLKEGEKRSAGFGPTPAAVSLAAIS